MEKNLAELFVLAACGKLALLEGADDLGGSDALGRLHDGSDTIHSYGEGASGLIERQDTIVEKDLKDCGSKGPASEGLADSQVRMVSHSESPKA